MCILFNCNDIDLCNFFPSLWGGLVKVLCLETASVKVPFFFSPIRSYVNGLDSSGFAIVTALSLEVIVTGKARDPNSDH